MKKTLFLIILIMSMKSALYPQITFSGILDSSFSMAAGSTHSFSCGFEEYANLRFQSKLREGGTVYGAVNLLAASGIPADSAFQMASLAAASPLSVSSYALGQNFAAAIELERLYFRLRGEHIDVDGGLMRLPFGYGQIWGPSDFLNSRNPMIQDARPRAILGASLTWYPVDELKLLGFFSAPQNALEVNGDGISFGLSMDYHRDKASIQALYSYEIPKAGSEYGLHRAGFSLKADIKVGLIIDALYVYNHEDGTEIDGLSFSIGFDYSFFGGDLIVLAEYLYNGGASSTSVKGGGAFSNSHYLYTGFTYRFNDFTNMSAGLVSCFDDISFLPSVVLNHELFQGITLIISAQVPLDSNLFNKDGKRGELGPDSAGGRYFNCNTKLRIRF